ncbi:repeat protein [Gardnerella vaginalis]|uniref:Repeat protein n=1 Tax=Gardnerella vaginalis TaxID=2702 RepID=A0A135Z4W7_GARVA|nr:InlB B-repeat-containing protein [Gardnerella vaginalis]KXI16692.1 repeat protein [Gardnerella vaginalis]
MVVRIPFGKMNVKFDLQGGSIDGKLDPIINTVKKNNSVDFPQNPTKENVEFGGWFTELPNIKYYQEHNMVGKRYYWNKKSLFSDSNCDLVQWNDENLDPRGDYQFLLRAQWDARATFDANGGVFNNKNESTKDEVTIAGKEIKLSQAPTRDDYQFLNWVDAAGNTYNPGDTYKLDANTAFTAQWKRIRNTVACNTVNCNTVTRDTVTFMNGADKYSSVNVESGKAIDDDEIDDQSMPKDPTKDGFTFKEWNTQADGKGDVFTGTTPVNSDMTIYAIFTKNPLPTPKPTPDSEQVAPVKKHSAIPNTGESTALPFLLFVLGFAIAGLSIIYKNRMLKEINE